MSNTSRNRNLIFIIAALLLTNIAVLVYFLWIKQPDDRKDGPNRPKDGLFAGLLKDSVGFTDEQIAKYKELKDQQKKTISPMFEEMRKAKDSLFRLIGNAGANDSAIQKAADAIGQRQQILDLQSFNHFREIRALCTSPEQQVKYDSAVLRMLRKMGKAPARHNNGKKEEKKK